MSVCPNCSWDNAFCQKCGQRLENEALVPKHEAFAPDHSHFEHGKVVNGDKHHAKSPSLLDKHVAAGFPIKMPDSFQVPQNPAKDVELNALRREVASYRDFWEDAAEAVGLRHPPRRVDTLPPERSYERQSVCFDDGYREFTREDVLDYLRQIRRGQR